jgi:hypothetical protein
MEGQLDWGFWLGISALVLAIPLGVITNLLTPRVMTFLERRKLIKTHKTRRQALESYDRMRAFHEGRKDKYAFYILSGSCAVISAMATSMIVILLILADIPTLDAKMITGLVAIICGLLALICLAGLYETARKLERFDDYKAEFEKRWGPIDT